MNVQIFLLLLALLIIARVTWRRGAYAWALGCTAAAILPALTLARTTNPFLLAGIAAALGVWLWHRHGRTMATVTRWGASARRKAGVASGTDIARAAGSVAMRRRAPIVRPSLRPERRWARIVQLVRLRVAEVGVELCRVGHARVWSSIEDFVVVFGGPRVGKSQWLAGRIIDAPGAVLVTSTRMDLLDQTGPLRAATGPVYVFNPVGLGDRESTITFDPLTGCANPVTAAERATDMFVAAADQGGDRQFWDDLGRANLAALLHAAALGDGLTMLDVHRWVADPKRYEPQIMSLLHQSPEPAFENAVAQFIGTNDRTRTSITSTISPALAWLTHGPARAAALPAQQGGRPFDVAALLASRAAVYMLGGREAQVYPLVAALTGHIAREARRLATLQPGGRLDPPLSLRLDEAALTRSIPLHEWSADMGGRGVSIVACFQSRAQLIDQYGDAKAATILNNAGGKLLFGGTGDRDDLTYWSTLAGERDEPITTTDMHGRVASRTVRRVPVLAPAQLAHLPGGRVVVFRRDMPPVIGRAEMAYRRRDVFTAHHPHAISVRARARLTAWTSAAAKPVLAAMAAVSARVRGWVATGVAVVARAVAPLSRRLPGRRRVTRYQPYRSPAVVPGEVVAPAWLARPELSRTPLPIEEGSPVVELDEYRRQVGPADGEGA